MTNKICERDKKSFFPPPPGYLFIGHVKEIIGSVQGIIEHVQDIIGSVQEIIEHVKDIFGSVQVFFLNCTRDYVICSRGYKKMFKRLLGVYYSLGDMFNRFLDRFKILLEVF